MDACVWCNSYFLSWKMWKMRHKIVWLLSDTAPLAVLTWRCIHESIIVPNFLQLHIFAHLQSKALGHVTKISELQSLGQSPGRCRFLSRSINLVRIGCKLVGIRDRELDGNLEGEKEEKVKRAVLLCRHLRSQVQILFHTERPLISIIWIVLSKILKL